MESRQFVMDTKGYCLLCLKLSSSREDGINQGEEEQVFSLRRVCHYLRVNLRRIFSDLVAATPASTSLSVLETSELKGVLCEECSQMNETISEITLELEVLQMTLDSLVKQIRDKLEGVGRNLELLKRFKTEMLSKPQTLLCYGIVEQFRKETLKKCSQMIKNAQPRVLLEKCAIDEIRNVERSESPSSPSPSGHDSPEAEGSLDCKFCQKSFRHKWLRADHEKTFHREHLQCDLCPKTFMFRVGLVTHRKRSHGVGSKRKAISPKKRKSDGVSKPNQSMNVEPTQLQINDHKVIQKFQCQFCPMSFSLRTSLLMHRYQEHKRVNTSSPGNQGPAPISKPEVGTRSNHQYKCEFCPAQFSHETSIYQHMTNFHNYQGTRKQLSTAIREVRSQLLSDTDRDNGPLETGDSDDEDIKGNEESNDKVMSNQKLGFLPEAEADQGPKAIKTSESEVFSKPSRSKRRPIHQVRQGPKFQCPYCPASYSIKASLGMHLHRNHRSQHQPLQRGSRKPKTGSSNPRFQCEYCPMKFTMACNKSRHMRKFHNHQSRRQRRRLVDKSQDDQPKSSSSVNLHVQVGDVEGVKGNVQRSSSQVQKPGSDKKFKCGRCRKQFYKRSSLHQHVTIAHLGSSVERKYECATCGKKFVQRGGLRSHQKTVHLGERYSCSFCSAQFTQPTAMKYHMKHVCPNRKS